MLCETKNFTMSFKKKIIMPIFVEKRSFSGTDCWWSPFKLTDVPEKDDDLHIFIEALKNSYIAFYTTVKEIHCIYVLQIHY